MTRKLLAPRDVAVKIGRSHDWFIKNRQALYGAGFPRPLLGDGPRGRARYDEAAIDAWFDTKMDPQLRHDAAAIRSVVTQQVTLYDALLEQRLKEVA